MSELLPLAEFAEASVYLVGYAGRDQTAVQAHVDELARHGVPAPTEVPAVWEVPSRLLTQDDTIAVSSADTSGEVEPVIVLGDGEPLLTVGSDHTDRGLERDSMDAAKQANAKVLSERAWPLPDDGRWDRLVLRSAIEVDGEWQLYQEAELSALLPPSWYLDRFGRNGPTVIFCGTVPTVGDLVTDAKAFRAELIDPDTGESLSCEYRIDRR